MLENLTREQLLFILQEVVHECTLDEEYHTEAIGKIEDELYNKPDDETFEKLLRSRSRHNAKLETAQDILRMVKHLSDVYNAYN